MESYQLEHLKKLLLREKMNHGPNDVEMEESELSSVDNHPADAATDLMTVTTDLVIEEFKEEEVDKIDAALAAIEEGSYGNCKECGKGIPYERLEAIPTALTCVDHTDGENI
ncbi:MAG: TraR/DksA C4-type zinc finger protein [Solibacillus sp.]